MDPRGGSVGKSSRSGSPEEGEAGQGGRGREGAGGALSTIQVCFWGSSETSAALGRVLLAAMCSVLTGGKWLWLLAWTGPQSDLFKSMSYVSTHKVSPLCFFESPGIRKYMSMFPRLQHANGVEWARNWCLRAWDETIWRKRSAKVQLESGGAGPDPRGQVSASKGRPRAVSTRAHRQAAPPAAPRPGPLTLPYPTLSSSLLTPPPTTKAPAPAVQDSINQSIWCGESRPQLGTGRPRFEFCWHRRLYDSRPFTSLLLSSSMKCAK